MSSSVHLLLKVGCHVAKLLLNVTDDLALGGGGESVTTFVEDLHEVISEVATREIQAADGMRKGMALVDGDRLGYPIPSVQHHTEVATKITEGEHGLVGKVHGRDFEGLEHDLNCLFAVGLGVKGYFTQEDRKFLRNNPKFVEESMVPHLLHVVPVVHNAAFDSVTSGEPFMQRF